MTATVVDGWFFEHKPTPKQLKSMKRHKARFPNDEATLRTHLSLLGLDVLAPYLVWISPQEFDERQPVGHGGFAFVERATIKLRESKIEVALKNMKFELTNDLKNELLYNIHLRFNGSPRWAPMPHLFGLSMTAEQKYSLVMQYAAGGTLEQLLRYAPPQSWRRVWQIAMGITRRLQVIHETGLVHCDLHPGNIVFNRLGDDSIPLIIDVGASKPLSQFRVNFAVGRLEYLPPEFFRSGPPTQGYDIYDLGLLLWQLTARFPPRGSSAIPWGGGITEPSTGLREESVPGTPECYCELYRDCWQSDPFSRPTVADVLKRLAENEAELMAAPWLDTIPEAVEHLTRREEEFVKEANRRKMRTESQAQTESTAMSSSGFMFVASTGSDLDSSTDVEEEPEEKSVSDEGGGMEAVDKKKIFDILQRGEKLEDLTRQDVEKVGQETIFVESANLVAARRDRRIVGAAHRIGEWFEHIAGNLKDVVMYVGSGKPYLSIPEKTEHDQSSLLQLKIIGFVASKGAFPDEWFLIESALHGLVLDVEESSKQPGARVILSERSSNDYNKSQGWTYRKGCILNENSGLALDVQVNDSESHWLLIQNVVSPDKTGYQRWRVGRKNIILSLTSPSLCITPLKSRASVEVFASEEKQQTEQHIELQWKLLVPIYQELSEGDSAEHSINTEEVEAGNDAKPSARAARKSNWFKRIQHGLSDPMESKEKLSQGGSLIGVTPAATAASATVFPGTVVEDFHVEAEAVNIPNSGGSSPLYSASSSFPLTSPSYSPTSPLYLSASPPYLPAIPSYSPTSPSSAGPTYLPTSYSSAGPSYPSVGPSYPSAGPSYLPTSRSSAGPSYPSAGPSYPSAASYPSAGGPPYTSTKPLEHEYINTDFDDADTKTEGKPKTGLFGGLFAGGKNEEEIKEEKITVTEKIIERKPEISVIEETVVTVGPGGQKIIEKKPNTSVIEETVIAVDSGTTYTGGKTVTDKITEKKPETSLIEKAVEVVVGVGGILAVGEFITEASNKPKTKEEINVRKDAYAAGSDVTGTGAVIIPTSGTAHVSFRCVFGEDLVGVLIHLAGADRKFDNKEFAVTVEDQGTKGAIDVAVVAAAQSDRRALITGDTNYFFSIPNTYGIVVLWGKAESKRMFRWLKPREKADAVGTLFKDHMQELENVYTTGDRVLAFWSEAKDDNGITRTTWELRQPREEEMASFVQKYMRGQQYRGGYEDYTLNQ